MNAEKCVGLYIAPIPYHCLHRDTELYTCIAYISKHNKTKQKVSTIDMITDYREAYILICGLVEEHLLQNNCIICDVASEMINMNHKSELSGGKHGIHY